ncbi:TPA: adhesion protein [Salmonella enterica subsp. enterica serovar Wedding]|nr:adhesion protein [Salmonella enterica subsp. enterica serovar Wedding]
MTARLFNMKVLILSGTIMLLAVCDSARAEYTSSKCDANGNVNIPDITLKGGKYFQGQELKKITVPISYTCTTDFWSSIGNLVYSPTVQIPGLGNTIKALKDSGLGMDILVQEGSNTPVLFAWQDVKNMGAGWSQAKTFGQRMEWDKTYSRSGTLTLNIFVDVVFTKNFLNVNIPASNIDIIPYNPKQNGYYLEPPTVGYRPLSVSAFNLRFIPDNSGRVIISPSVVNLGHFYTEYKDTLVAREAPFTVTAQQNIGTQSPFVAPLAIEFKTNGLTLADADTSVTLKNTKGEANGFRLSVMDEAGDPVKFNVKADMGSISLDNGSGGKIIKNYKAKVAPIQGAVIKTGSFSAAMTVVVTYI